VERDRWNEVDIEIYYHPDHAYNVRRMVEAVQKSLDYFSSAFSPYQYRQMRILEFPRYRSFAQAFPNTVPFSESLGFIARLDDPDEIDYVFYVMAHEVAHQWWAHQVIGADVQGATLLSETLAQYSALMVMEKEYGRQMMRRFLKYELDRYLAARGTEQIEELPLMLMENQSYIHYQKGSLAMYALRNYIGAEAVNRALSCFVEEWGFRGPPYPTAHDLMAFLEAEVPLDKRWIIEDFFKTITLYDNRATEAILEPLDDGRYNLRLSVESRKYRSDGDGAQTPAPVDAWIDIAVFAFGRLRSARRQGATAGKTPHNRRHNGDRGTGQRRAQKSRHRPV
jgi:ABC-2 type transport system permease protein